MSVQTPQPAPSRGGIGAAGSLAFTVTHPHECSPRVRSAVLHRVRIFRGLDERVLQEIDALMVASSAPAGALLCREQEPARSMHVLVAGRAKSFRVSADGREVIASLLGPGDVFGAPVLLGPVVHPTSVQALTDACTLRLDAAALHALLRRFPEIALRVIDELGDQLHLALDSAALLAAASVQERVASHLDRLCDRFGTASPRMPGVIELSLPLSRADLAGLTGATIESVSRVMSAMQREGIIRSGRGWTIVLDRDRLRELADSAPACRRA